MDEYTNLNNDEEEKKNNQFSNLNDAGVESFTIDGTQKKNNQSSNNNNIVEENFTKKRKSTIRYNAAELEEVSQRSTDTNYETKVSNSNNDQENESFIGKVIDNKYKVIELLGKGGMGSVYKVEHLLLKKYFAVKILHSDLLKSEVNKKRFFREAQLCMSFNHENILPIREFNEVNGNPYFTMDYSHGSSLKSMMEEAKLPEARIISIMRQVLSALQVAHSKGIIHRDLKPENIFIEIRDEKYHALLLDFGIAKIYEKDSDNTQLTGKHTIGTPYYMAPEQARGEELDARSDLYSLGIIFYEMATGKIPFKGSTHVDTLVSRLTLELPLPSSINPEISKSVEGVIVKALQRERQDRFKDTEEFYEALSYIVETETNSHKKKRSLEEILETSTFKIDPDLKKKKNRWIYAAAIILFVVSVAIYFVDELIKQNAKENSTINTIQDNKKQETDNLALIKKVKYIEIVPNKITLKPNTRHEFQSIPYNKFGYPTNFPSSVTWSTSIGKIDNTGTFVAPEKPGEGVIRISSSNIIGYAKVTIKNPDIFRVRMRLVDDKKRSKKHFLLNEKIYIGFQYKKYVKKKLQLKVSSEGMLKPITWHSKKHTRKETIYIPLKISQIEKEYKLQVDASIEDFNKTYTLSFKLNALKDKPEQWSAKLWKDCWNGKWLDFTSKIWENLSVDKKKIYTREYQKWFAYNHGLSLKDSIVLPDDKTKIHMILLPPGQYWMGSPSNEEERDLNEGPRHKVIIKKAFWMSQYEITNAIWNQVMGKASTNQSFFPSTNISWNDCQEFCKEMDVQLPTEEQWEYACRSGSTTKYFWGNKFDSLYSWSSQSSQFKISEVGKTKPNSFDLYDMSGNVFEWCQDRWLSSYNEKEFKNTRVYRGGSFWSSPRVCRSSYRDRNPASYRVQFLGFRVVKKIQ
ncbi:bifunctional serine/threonine-protein kinase/formylglycine-generating enzyme family protein [Candidatus Uabimicrobium sp. HlEnr_7]|uniref:bifunctional serine/threonine-protein kinase/formylglycine-generating enzyme family protein n=1 Tax=Candidatus Uabimicrobium helgolandensis TaxID=3095367 RepID=UPI003556D963